VPSARRLDAFGDGQDAEKFVEAFLVDDGWEVLARNWRGGGSEIDLVVRRDARVRLVEVKARQASDDSGLEAIGPEKRRRLRRGGEAWLAEHGSDFRAPDGTGEIAFLVALVTLGDGVWGLELIDDAF
jgi:Holliday junction resolvase-like predicted endonuclease